MSLTEEQWRLGKVVAQKFNKGLRLSKAGKYKAGSDQLTECAKLCGSHDSPMAMKVMKALNSNHLAWAVTSKDRNQLQTARVCAMQMDAMAARLGIHELKREAKEALAMVKEVEQSEIFAIRRVFRANDSVRLHGLVSRADLNGSQATVLGVAPNGLKASTTSICTSYALHLVRLEYPALLTGVFVCCLFVCLFVCLLTLV